RETRGRTGGVVVLRYSSSGSLRYGRRVIARDGEPNSSPAPSNSESLAGASPLIVCPADAVSRSPKSIEEIPVNENTPIVGVGDNNVEVAEPVAEVEATKREVHAQQEAVADVIRPVD